MGGSRRWVGVHKWMGRGGGVVGGQEVKGV